MTNTEIVLNAAIFACSKLQDNGNISYKVKDKTGTWYIMDWDAVIRELYNMLKGDINADRN